MDGWVNKKKKKRSVLSGIVFYGFKVANGEKGTTCIRRKKEGRKELRYHQQWWV